MPEYTPQQMQRIRDTTINKAIADRAIPEAKRDFYERMWEVDPSETLGLLTSMGKADAPAPAPTATPASDAPAQQAGDDYPDTFLTPEERHRIDGAKAGAVPPRIVQEPGGAAA
jgi:hypothetical protein